MEALGLSFDNMMGGEEIDNLFDDTENTAEETAEEAQEKPEKSSRPDKHDDTETTEVVDPEGLFDDDEDGKQPESVGSEKDTEGEKGDSSTDDGGGTSPNNNFYSSIANAMAEDGIFPNLDEEEIAKADSAEALSDLIEKEVNARLDEKQQRISKALENGVEPTDIKRYEGALQYLNGITDKLLTAEDTEGEKLRMNIIYQDYINNGYSEERAKKLTQRSIDNGNDIEDAKEALQSNKEYFQKEYRKLLDKADEDAAKEKADRQKKSEKLKRSFMEDKQLFGDMEISKDIRKKAYEKISKPVYKDPETGQYLTAIQRFEQEHPEDFIKYVSLFMTLTNDFKDFDSFVKGKVKKAEKKGLSRLEQVLANTRRDAGGNLKMLNSKDDDPESFISGFRLDLP